MNIKTKTKNSLRTLDSKSIRESSSKTAKARLWTKKDSRKKFIYKERERKKRRNLIFVCVWTHYCCGLSAHLCCVCVVKRTFYAKFISICIWTYKKQIFFVAELNWIFFPWNFIAWKTKTEKRKNIKIKIVCYSCY